MSLLLTARRERLWFVGIDDGDFVRVGRFECRHQLLWTALNDYERTGRLNRTWYLRLSVQRFGPAQFRSQSRGTHGLDMQS